MISYWNGELRHSYFSNSAPCTACGPHGAWHIHQATGANPEHTGPCSRCHGTRREPTAMELRLRAQDVIDD